MGVVHRSGSVLVDWLLRPASIAHELTHLLPLLPWLESADVSLAGRAGISGDAPDAPVWAYRLAAIAPTLVGTLIAMVVYVLVVVQGDPELTITIKQGLAIEAGLKPVAWMLGTAWWYWYTLPSERDRAAFLNPADE